MLNLGCRLTGKEKKVGLFDLMWDDGPVFLDEGGMEDVVSLQTASTNANLGENCILSYLRYEKQFVHFLKVGMFFSLLFCIVNDQA